MELTVRIRERILVKGVEKGETGKPFRAVAPDITWHLGYLSYLISFAIRLEELYIYIFIY